MPDQMKAVVVAGDRDTQLVMIDVPQIAVDQIKIKVHAVAQNPSEWMVIQRFNPSGAIIGSDFVGTVVEIGTAVPTGVRNIGERVVGFVHEAIGDHGAFAEYIITDPHFVIALPPPSEGGWSDEEAPQLGLCAYTACQALWESQQGLPIPKGTNLPRPPPPRPASSHPTDTTLIGEGSYLLVWSASSSVGQLVVQLADLSGLRVIATSSPRNFDFVKSLGATHVFDYADPETPKKIRELTDSVGGLKRAVDCVSNKQSVQQISECFSQDGGVCAVVLPVDNEVEHLRKDVNFVFSMVYDLHGKPYSRPITHPGYPEDYARGVYFSNLLSAVMAQGPLQGRSPLKPNRVKLFPLGLASVKEGLTYMMDGKVSAEKITYRISDTPDI